MTVNGNSGSLERSHIADHHDSWNISAVLPMLVEMCYIVAPEKTTGLKILIMGRADNRLILGLWLPTVRLKHGDMQREKERSYNPLCA